MRKTPVCVCVCDLKFGQCKCECLCVLVCYWACWHGCSQISRMNGSDAMLGHDVAQQPNAHQFDVRLGPQAKERGATPTLRSKLTRACARWGLKRAPRSVTATRAFLLRPWSSVCLSPTGECVYAWLGVEGVDVSGCGSIPSPKWTVAIGVDVIVSSLGILAFVSSIFSCVRCR